MDMEDMSSNEVMTPRDTSDSSESVLPLTTEPTLPDTEPTKPRLKGVVKQQDGHYGAQIYVDNQRIELGTFKTVAEAAAAYDSASIKLRSFDANSYRNFPWCEITAQEPDFQECYTTEAVLNMIRDGSYQHKFRDFLDKKTKESLKLEDKGIKSDQKRIKEGLNCLVL